MTKIKVIASINGGADETRTVEVNLTPQQRAAAQSGEDIFILMSLAADALIAEGQVMVSQAMILEPNEVA